MNSFDALENFLGPVRQWFRAALGAPTEAQRQGWPAIMAGQHTLILAPTGSGKTLAAFLACLDRLWRQDPLPAGTRVLYISPLKALNNDIRRNLREPLAGVVETARLMEQQLPPIEVGLRSGDTSAADRQRLIRRPPHVLITTPESLHLMLTSRARDTLTNLTHVIVDEIHALCPNKRGVFLSLLLERLEALNPQSFVRIGLSATQRPLAEVALYLGGNEFSDGAITPRPVTIVDAGMRKDLDLAVLSPVKEFGPLPEKSIWPSIYRLLDQHIRQHRSTLVFANNRRTVERITTNLNKDEPLARAHHGSVSLEVRHETEQALKEGRLPAVVATASLELGIDMGAVDLVCQVESPGSVARALQRVGRAGHLVGCQSKGRLIGKTPIDLLEQAVLAREMVAGHVEEIRPPRNCLDVLAQQIVAMVAVDVWGVTDLYALVRRAYSFRDLTPQMFEAVLEMISGRYRFQAGDAAASVEPAQRPAALQPRVSWDRVHNQLLALPATRAFAVTNGGTIPDTGQYAAYAPDGTRIGELDEEFVYERRVGDVFLLGTTAWRLEKVETDRVRLSPAQGAPAMVPFWRGERAGRSFDLGLAMGRFVRELGGRLDQPDTIAWLQKEFFLEANAARSVHHLVRRQLHHSGYLPSDQTIVIEAWRDTLGDWHVALLSPFGSRLHFALRLALEARLRRRLGYVPQCLHHDNGILFRFVDAPEPVLDLFEGLSAEGVEAVVLDELADSALFALRFRQNAARALLLPRLRPGKRAPLWLQRLRGRDLLQVARRQPDFPIIAETFRECLHDHLDVPRLRDLLADVAAGRIKVTTSRPNTPSPFASGLLFAFTMAFMYEYDDTEAESGRFPDLDKKLLEQLVAPQQEGHLLDPRAVHQVERRLRGLGRPPRTTPEMAEWLRRLGDIAPSELEGPMAGFLDELTADGRVQQISIAASPGSRRWILSEEVELYELALAGGENPGRAGEAILERFLQTHALVGLQDILDRYPFPPDWVKQKLDAWVRCGQVISAPRREESAPAQWAVPANLDQVQRTALSILRNEVTPCTPTQFAAFVLRWQQLVPAAPSADAAGLTEILDRLQGLALPAELWEQTVLPARLQSYQPAWLDENLASGEWTWVCRSDSDAGPGLLAFMRRESLALLPRPPAAENQTPDPDVARVLDCLKTRGAQYVTDIAQETTLAPSAVRAGLWALTRQGLVNNDRFDVIRKSEMPAPVTGRERSNGPGSRLSSSMFRPRGIQRAEGRWSLIPWREPTPEAQAVHAATFLLGRYGVVFRQLAALDPWMVPWRALLDVLGRMELAGELRRGYFVEGVAGAQFALPEAARMLRDLDLPAHGKAELVLLHSQDPANLHGSGGAFPISLLDGAEQSFARRPGNWLVVRAGAPILLVEQQGRRLLALPNASRKDLVEAIACLPAMLQNDQGLAARHKITVEEWNNAPVTKTEGADFLEAAGFVRDYQSMTLYGGLR